MQSNYDKLLALGIPLRKSSGQTKTVCPRCSHNRATVNRKEACLSIDIDNGSYTCWNSPCDFQGNVSERSPYVPQKQYVRPVWANNTNLSDGLVQYWQSRGISQKTLIKIKLAEGLKWLPYPGYEIWTMQFPYFRNGELINIKYRGNVPIINRDGSPGIKKAFNQVTDAEKIFFNIDSILNTDECTIVEGEPDCISYIECDYETVVSVPNGASLSKNNLDYLDNCILYFENKTKIFIAVDNDEAGRSLQAELIRRLGPERCWIIDYADCKDGNAYMLKYGKIALMHLHTVAKPAQISGIVEADDMWPGVVDIWEKGLPPGFKIDVKDVDDHISFPVGGFTIITGIPNHGKGPMLRYLLSRLALLHGWKAGLFCPEDEPIALNILKYISLVTGRSAAIKYGETNRITRDELEYAKSFINAHFKFISQDRRSVFEKDLHLKKFTLENVLELGRKMVFRYGINALVIDPWNKLEHKRTKEHFEEKNYISDKLDEILDFGRIYGVHMLVVAHPTKMEEDRRLGKNGEYKIPNLYSISGAAEFFSKPDVGFTVYRNQKNITSMIVNKMKHDHIGKKGKIDFDYDWISGRFNVVGCDPDRSNWLLTKPVSQGYGGSIMSVFENPPVYNNSNIPDF